MNREKYRELKDELYHHKFEGIDYIFGGKKELQEYLNRTGYTEDDFKSGKLVTGIGGAIGTKEAFEARDKYYNEWEEKVKTQCDAESIFIDEWWNHECGLTYDYNEALSIAHNYFPDYKPKKSLLNKLQKQFEKLNW